MKLPADSIKKWADLKKFFLARFFKDDTKVSMPMLLVTKQKKEESIKVFVKRFQNMALWCPGNMTQSTLVKTYHHNLQTTLLAQIEVIQSRTCKQFVLQGEWAEDIVARINQEDYKST